MNEKEIIIAFWTLIISSILNLFTIASNIYWNSVGKREKKNLENYVNIRDTILKYYLPIKYTLLQLELCQLKIKEQKEQFDIFSLYSNDSEMRAFREELVTEYRYYIKVYDKLQIRYANSLIDKKLDRVYMHVQFILSVNDQRILNKYKGKYEMPCLSEVIDEIDRYSLDNKVFL